MINIVDVTFVLPSRNTINYLKMAYNSIRKYYPANEIIILDESDQDNSWEWVESINDKNLVKWKNTTGNLLGHTITYDIGISMARNDLVTIIHSDMVISENYLENLIKHWKPKTVVSATRVEPQGIYPPGDEKILMPFGAYDHDFKSYEFEVFAKKLTIVNKGKTTRGIFAPWLISRKDFIQHDYVNYAPFPIPFFAQFL